MKHVWSVLCQTSIRDEETSRTSIINSMDSIGFIVDRKKFETKKNIPTNLEIVSLWNNKINKGGEFLIKIELIDSNKKVLISSELPGVKSSDKSVRSATTRMAINLLPVTIAGEYTFKVSQKFLEDKKFATVAELPLEIKIKFQEEK